MDKYRKLKDVKLIVCDIDNTLVRKRQDLSERGQQAVRKLKEKGILFGLASGRGTKQLHEFAERWGIECDLLIGMNGAEIQDGIDNTYELYYKMKKEWLKEVFEIMAPFEANAHVDREGMLYVTRIDENVAASMKYAKEKRNIRIVEDRSEFWQGDAIKACFRVKADIMPAIEERVAQFPSENFVGLKTENTMFEFGNKQASKGKALELFCDKHGINIEDTCAFGDMTNDISMLEAAGIAVCMLNGSDDAKAVSDIITDKTVDEDGWTVFVEDYIL